MFIDSLPFTYVARIFDIFLIEGPKILYRAALAILSLLEEKLLAAGDISVLDGILRDLLHWIPSLVTEDKFIQKCVSFRFSKKLIVKLKLKNNGNDSKDLD